MRLALLAMVVVAWGVSGCGTFGRRTPLLRNRERLGTEEEIRTVASVGERDMPVVAGTPGESVASDVAASERAPAAEGRISGRVLDENDDPVADAVVRLAVGGRSGGRSISAVTDGSGGFTLQGLRPGETYTLIAEA